MALELYGRAKREIVIVGVTGFHSLIHQKTYFAALEQAIDADRRVYLLIMHPDSPDLPTVSPDGQTTLEEVRTALRKHGFSTHPNFAVRFTMRLQPYSAVMIDGDLKARGLPDDEGAEVRIHPLSLYMSPYARGVMLHFRKSDGLRPPIGGFEYFSEDLRKRWDKEGKEYPELLAPPSAPRARVKSRAPHGSARGSRRRSK